MHPEVKNWIKYAKFEEKNGYINSARIIYERAVEFFGEDNVDEKILLAFAKFEEGQKEVRHGIDGEGDLYMWYFLYAWLCLCIDSTLRICDSMVLCQDFFFFLFFQY